ncbi:nitric oxide reductase NorD protein [Rhodobacter sp. JA431]|uniref:Nitric oxide reductase NorD protein n=1 Tax=Phaeovulum vinaykumarii TaxID=407234 RepID=A0A1N7MXV0_9RHOB|nr:MULTISPECIES: nitric oxide reductase D protein [Paracoccaceae]SIS90925.1 nitric oxide reductase NorD protein [Phaeovulum vinaykumarii]SOC15963.1 nitric oxide reductase NorD protein [Phaeovulum vinaykumarii]SOC16295.1 nitric oxide reductase NorD protein [Rhodobacter sp. JA431]
MTRIEFEPWEPEESIGKLWHRFASGLDAPVSHDAARVDLAEVAGRLAVLYRGLGGAPSTEIRPVAAETSRHRLSFRRRLGIEAEAIPRASFDGEALRLPASLALFPAREANAATYLWLAACAALAPAPQTPPEDPLAADLARIATARAMVAATLSEAPGLAPLYADLCAATLATRPRPALPPVEAAVEALIRAELGDTSNLPARAQDLPATAPRGYRPARPVTLWPDLRPLTLSDGSGVETRDAAPADEATSGEGKTHRARRHKSDQVERNDSFILHKFEAILSWAEFLNLNRRVEDDENDDAKKAADDQEELGLGQISKAPATRLKLHLDLAPEDAARERLSGRHLYPEWEARSGRYLPDHCVVLASMAAESPEPPAFRTDPASARRIRAVRAQFEALRPGRVFTTGHLDGDEIDLEATVRAATDLRATGTASARLWKQSRPQRRDLAVSILLDVSRSTESAVAGRAVIDIEREALAALAWGLDATGDDVAINAFSSLKRDRVFLLTCKDFGEKMGPAVEARIAGLRPGFYTRLGAAVRHASAGLAQQGRKRRLLLIITDGKPNDLDHYEGRHGLEDSRMAVREARMAGQSVFGITVEREAKASFARIFGQGGFAVIPHADHLTAALPEIWRHLVGA